MTDQRIATLVMQDSDLYLFYRRSKRPRQRVDNFIAENRDTLMAIIESRGIRCAVHKS